MLLFEFSSSSPFGFTNVGFVPGLLLLSLLPFNLFLILLQVRFQLQRILWYIQFRLLNFTLLLLAFLLNDLPDSLL